MEELSFPALPAPQSYVSWPHPVVSAHHILATKFDSVVTALRTDDGHLDRLCYLRSTLESDCLPLLLKLQSSGLPLDFVEMCLDCLTDAAAHLEISIESIQEM